MEPAVRRIRGHLQCVLGSQSGAPGSGGSESTGPDPALRESQAWPLGATTADRDVARDGAAHCTGALYNPYTPDPLAPQGSHGPGSCPESCVAAGILPHTRLPLANKMSIDTISDTLNILQLPDLGAPSDGLNGCSSIIWSVSLHPRFPHTRET